MGCGQEAKAKTVIISGIAVTASQFLVVLILEFTECLANYREYCILYLFGLCNKTNGALDNSVS